MKIVNYLFLALVLVSSCKDEETVENPVLPNDYGKGMYIVTENGISFYDGEVVKNQIYKKVNGSSMLNAKKIKFKGTKVYIVADDIVTANVNTFENREIISGFSNPVDFEFISFDRLFVVDKGDARVKVVDLSNLEITSEIETGENTNPTFIISQWYRSITLNGGAVPDSLKDSTIVAIDYRDGVIPLANFMGSIEIGDNPNSAVWSGHIKVLCKGIYDPNNPASNKESSLYNIEPWNFDIYWNKTLSGIFNARHLIASPSSSKFYFLAEGGVYWMPLDASYTTQIINIESDVLLRRNEWYAINDTTDALSDMLYINDAISANNIIYKYNFATSAFCDTIVVDGAIKDINFY